MRAVKAAGFRRREAGPQRGHSKGPDEAHRPSGVALPSLQT